MIIGIAVMLVVGLILATGWWNEVNKNRELKQQLRDEQEAKAKLLPKDESKGVQLIKQSAQNGFGEARKVIDEYKL